MTSTIPLSNLNSGQSIYTPVVALSSVANVTAWDLDDAQNASLIMTENTTLDEPTGMSGKSGKWCVLEVVQDGSTAFELFFDPVFTNSGTLPPLPPALGAKHGFLMYCTGTEMQVWIFSQNVG